MPPRYTSFFEQHTNPDILIAKRLTDHPMLDSVIPIKGKKTPIRLFSLNMLIPKSIIFELTDKGLHTRLTFPIEWFLKDNLIMAVNMFLKPYDMAVKIYLYHDQQPTLLLVNCQTGSPADQLPYSQSGGYIKRVLLEDEATFKNRITCLGKYIGNQLSSAKEKNQIAFFALQELQNNPDTITYFLEAINSVSANLSIKIAVEDASNHIPYKSAILYDSSVTSLLEDDENEAVINNSLASLFPTTKSVGHLCTRSFKLNNTYQSITLASVHFYFSVINQETSPSNINIMELLDAIASKYNIIMVGDFNKKICAEDELIHLASTANSRQRNCLFFSTSPGLQPYDTIDAILAPQEYQCGLIDYQPSQMYQASL